MPIEKQSLNNFLPNGFETLNQEGYKENFSEDKIKTGYEKDVPDIVSGPNFNNLIDVVGKNTNTLNSYVEYLNGMPINNVPIVNENNQLDYKDISKFMDNKANIHLDNLSDAGADKLNTSKMYLTGAVSEDEQGYNQLVGMKQNAVGTGIDTIKPDNYEVVGSPVISEDGMLTTSNYSSAYVKVSLPTFGDNWDVIFPYNRPNKVDWHTLDTIFRYPAQYEAFSIGSHGTQYNLWLKDIDGNSYSTAFTPYDGYNTFTDDLIKLSCINGTTLNIYVSKDKGQNWKLKKTITATSKLYICNIQNPTFIICTLWNDTGAAIDLNSFKIYVDGNLVYQPCLKIPYTETHPKYGSKIVDGIYRDRVIDCYEQGYPQKYYTIDEENQNFTLPMGEIYGMIEEKANKNNVLNKSQITNCILEAPYGVATYSGTTITVKHGLKVLVPNGRNVDGSMNNIEYTLTEDTDYVGYFGGTNDCRILTLHINDDNQAILGSFINTIPVYIQETQPTIFFEGYAYWYKPSENKTYWAENSVFSELPIVLLGRYYCTVNPNTVTSLKPNQTVELLKRTDKSEIINWGVPSDKNINLTLTIGSLQQFTAPANGYYSLKIKASAIGQIAALVYLDNQFSTQMYSSAANEELGVYLPVKKGKVIGALASTGTSVIRFCFTYLEGNKDD